MVAAAHLIPRTACTRWDQVEGHDVPSWIVWLLGLYSDAYPSNQYRALQQFFMRRAEEEELPDRRVSPDGGSDRFSSECEYIAHVAEQALDALEAIGNRCCAKSAPLGQKSPVPETVPARRVSAGLVYETLHGVGNGSRGFAH